MDQDPSTEFEQAFAEMAADRTGAPAQEAPAAEPAPAPPAPEQASEQAAPAAEVPTLDQVQAQLRDMAHRERSASSRISAFARENNQLKAMVEDLKRKIGAPAAPAPVAQSTEPDVLTDAPDLESAVQRRVNALIEPLNKRLEEAATRADAADRMAAEARQLVEPISRRNADEQIAATHQALDSQFTARWREDIRSAEFSDWLPSQPTWVQSLYAEGVTPEDSATVLGRFYASGRRPTPTQPAPAAAPSGQTPQQRLRDASGIAPRGAARPKTGPADDDFEGHFAEAARLRTTQQVNSNVNHLR